MAEKKFSLALNVKNISPGHVTFTMSAAMMPSGHSHRDAAGRSSLGGKLVLRVEEEWPAFIERTKPDLIYADSDVEIHGYSFLEPVKDWQRPVHVRMVSNEG